MPKLPAILKLLFDLDILDEKVVLEWGSKVSLMALIFNFINLLFDVQVQKKNVGKEIAQEIYDRAQPFIKWLKEAEEEDSESEEEEEIEVVYDERIRPDKIIQIEEQAVVDKKTVDNKAVDDIDIDAIQSTLNSTSIRFCFQLFFTVFVFQT